MQDPKNKQLEYPFLDTQVLEICEDRPRPNKPTNRNTSNQFHCMQVQIRLKLWKPPKYKENNKL